MTFENKIDINKDLDRILDECRPCISEGKVASYIPELAKSDPSKLGVYIIFGDAEYFSGDYDMTFTMQSVVKPLILLLALEDSGVEKVRELVGVEATGKPFDTFNYTDLALRNEHINPMINAGAIALCTLIKGDTYKDKTQRLLEFTRRLAKNDTLDVDRDVYASEKATGNKNRALAYMLNAYKMIDESVEDLLDCYFSACSIKVDCKDLANIAFELSHSKPDGMLRDEDARFVNAILSTSGMYDGSGEFALKVGVPAKSGVGGGIMAVVPGRMGIGVYSPALDSKGNSVAGKKVLEILSKQMNLSIF
jgi:glutaminase